LPDGRVIVIGNERFRCPEYLFKPLDMNGNILPGIHELINNSIQDCDIDKRACFYKNIVLSGGYTMIEGIGERLHKDIEA
jgi:actin